eukprot:10663927-Lingulodinium_polyedra.AAC.1
MNAKTSSGAATGFDAGCNCGRTRTKYNHITPLARKTAYARQLELATRTLDDLTKRRADTSRTKTN